VQKAVPISNQIVSVVGLADNQGRTVRRSECGWLGCGLL